ncbi:MAG: START domain-containing protein [Bacteroidia bacterium]
MRILLCLLFYVSCFSQENEDGWQKKKHHKGIEVYSRKTANSNFRELKSVIYVKTSLNSIVALLCDWESYPQWVYRCGESKTLRKLSATEVVHYQTVVAIWPSDNRDFVVNIKYSQDEKTKVITMKSSCNADYTPEIEHYVRVREFKATWTLVPYKDGTVQLTYQLLVHPGGSVPAWLVNMAAVDGPYLTMLNFKEWIMKEKYQKAKSPLVKELTD